MKIIDTVSMGETLYEQGRQAEGVWLKDFMGLIMNTKNIAVEDWRKYNEPYRSSDWQVIVILEGSCRVSYNLLELKRTKGEVFVQKPGTLVTQLSGTPDLNVRSLSIHPDLLPTLSLKHDYVRIMPAAGHFDTVLSYFDLLCRLTQTSDIRVMSDLAASLFRFILHLHETTTAPADHTLSQPVSRQTKVFRQFLSLLILHGTRQHKIAFYADQLAMTPNYLNSIVRQVSGRTMTAWINEYLIAEAKAALSHSDMTVENIAHALCFPNSAFFCRFFKTHTGYRPSQYRNRA